MSYAQPSPPMIHVSVRTRATIERLRASEDAVDADALRLLYRLSRDRS